MTEKPQGLWFTQKTLKQPKCLRKTGKTFDATDVADANKLLKQTGSIEDVTKSTLKKLDNYDDVAKGVIKRSDEIADAASKVVKRVEKPSSRKLTRNLKKAGINKPKDYKAAAHHIVAGGDPNAAKSRTILERFEIGINDASNGVFLPYEKNAPTNAVYHTSLNTQEYNAKVHEMLQYAESREEVLSILERIRDLLLQGKFLN